MATFPVLPSDIHTLAPADLPGAFLSGRYDALVLLRGTSSPSVTLPETLAEALAVAQRVDAALSTDNRTVTCLPVKNLPGERLVIATTGDLTPWETDVRAFALAAAAAMQRALQAGARRPLVLLTGVPPEPRYARAWPVVVLASLGALWRPFELRAAGQRELLVDAVGFVTDDAPAVLASLVHLEMARVVARDITGTDPETMSAEGIAAYSEALFHGTSLRVDVERDPARIAAAFPLLGAVAQGSLPVPRHHPRIVRLTYEGAGPIKQTLFFAGKGLTYDTGGADVKIDGHMAGMSRDKGGAGAVLGLFHLLAAHQPPGIRAVGLLGCVRNSIGSNGFVTDDILVGRSGLRVRVGNTDAEGRLVLADLLAALREEAEHALSPVVTSIATLTGHAALAVGPCTVAMENGPAQQRDFAKRLAHAGDAYGDLVEPSRLRAEDYAFVAAKSPAEDILSSNTLPSSRTPRGHQFPAAFLDIASGLRRHHAAGGAPLPFVHLDIAGSAVAGGSWQTGVPTGAPVVALWKGWLGDG